MSQRQNATFWCLCHVHDLTASAQKGSIVRSSTVHRDVIPERSFMTPSICIFSLRSRTSNLLRWCKAACHHLYMHFFQNFKIAFLGLVVNQHYYFQNSLQCRKINDKLQHSSKNPCFCTEVKNMWSASPILRNPVVQHFSMKLFCIEVKLFFLLSEGFQIEHQQRDG